MSDSASRATRNRRKRFRNALGAVIAGGLIGALTSAAQPADDPSLPPEDSAKEASEREPEPSPPPPKDPARARKPQEKFEPSERIEAESVVAFPTDI